MAGEAMGQITKQIKGRDWSEVLSLLLTFTHRNAAVPKAFHSNQDTVTSRTAF